MLCTAAAADLGYPRHLFVTMQILPTAFLASHDEVSSVSGVWASVWSEGCPSEPAALRMFAPELAGIIAGGIASSSWDRKKGAAKVRLRGLLAGGTYGVWKSSPLPAESAPPAHHFCPDHLPRLFTAEQTVNQFTAEAVCSRQRQGCVVYKADSQ